ncbi:MAG: hydroxyethylthiazole kinase [Spirochaetaceae bacterium]|jgi:hydroxyethylthiazole kinase|nr:hydroxyethylthiazole kinase [Spirochaetaceae bacterium]
MTGLYTEIADLVRARKPLVHHITNYVTVNDCANMTLNIGGSPIMADALEEAEEIAGLASALVLNMGTLNERTIPSMLAAGRAANRRGIPVVFDPVGAGAGKLRNETAERILEEVQITVLRGNISEIRFIAGLRSETKGVDASERDLADQGGAEEAAKSLARKLECVTAVTGPVDIVSDGKKVIRIENGHPLLAEITGTGCMCSSLTGACCGAVPESPLEAAVCALLCMGIAGELAYEKAGTEGNGSFRMALHDAVSRMNAETLAGRARIYEA